jgi:hypothetical protein
MLQEGELPIAERSKFLDMALRNAERLNSTLSQLLDLSRLVSGRLVCRFHEVALSHLIARELERVESEAKNTSRVFNAESCLAVVSGLPVILGDAPRLELVLRALFDNALKFSPEGGALSLKIKSQVKGSSLPSGMTMKAGLGILIELSNPMEPGQSISTGEIDKIFSVFSQHERVLDRTHEGVGGSLAIAAEVIHQHGGSMLAKTVDGRFTVWVALPVLESEKALLKVLESRMYALKTEIGAISLMILEVGEKAMKQVGEALKVALFRASDTVYTLNEGQIAVVMDDCKKADAPKIVRRLLQNLGSESTKFLRTEKARVGLASGPDDTTDPERLLALARESLVSIAEF